MQLIRRLEEERGNALPELLVVFLIMPIVGAMVFNGIVISTRVAARSQERVASLAEVQKTLDRVAMQVRSGVPVTLTPSAVTVDVVRNGRRERFAYSITATSLQQTLTIWSDPLANPATTAPASTATSVVVDELTTSSGLATTFTFADRVGGTLTSTCPASTGIAWPLCVDRVSIRVVRAIPDQQPLVVHTQVDLRNVYLNEVQS